MGHGVSLLWQGRLLVAADGYKQGHSADDCFALLYEAVCYANTWKDATLVLAAQDIQTAYDGVEQCHAFQHLFEEGATARQVLALARD